MDWSLTSGRWTAAPPQVRDEPGGGARVGAYALERPLGRHDLADRWLARAASGEPALAYRVDRLAGGRSPRAFVLAVGVLASLEHPHLGRILAIEPEVAGGRWLITTYPGVSQGVITLDDLLKERDDGALRPTEVRWLVEHLLSASAYAKARGVGHGPIGLHEVIIDRAGRASVELYGLARRLRGEPVGGPELARDELRSIATLAYRAATGRDPRPQGPFRIPVGDQRLGEWVADTLGGAEMSAWDALARLARHDASIGRSTGLLARIATRFRRSEDDETVAGLTAGV